MWFRKSIVGRGNTKIINHKNDLSHREVWTLNKVSLKMEITCDKTSTGFCYSVYSRKTCCYKTKNLFWNSKFFSFKENTPHLWLVLYKFATSFRCRQFKRIIIHLKTRNFPHLKKILSIVQRMCIYTCKRVRNIERCVCLVIEDFIRTYYLIILLIKTFHLNIKKAITSKSKL